MVVVGGLRMWEMVCGRSWSGGRLGGKGRVGEGRNGRTGKGISRAPTGSDTDSEGGEGPTPGPPETGGT